MPLFLKCIWIGIIVSFVLIIASFGDWFDWYEPLPVAPSPLVDLVTTGDGTLYADAEDEQTYGCLPYRDDCWELKDPPTKDSLGIKLEVFECSPMARLRWHLAHPFLSIRDCFHSNPRLIDAVGEETYILDENQRVWSRGVSHSSMDTTVLLCFIPFICISLSLLVGVAITGGRWMLKKGWL